ncbi:MAG TPA: phosphomannomutase/phosphoglucomutase [Bacteroidales bacterium]|nr:phosphomannomutase/phosphoglucomutase [Bacteroidales bacterium]
MKAFKAYDIRGVYNRDFDKNDAYKIGFFLPDLLKTNRVLVGFDARISSPEIFEYLSKGITDAGADVYVAGLATTPMIYYLSAKHNFDASVQITASHNAKEYNGMKVSRTNALPVGFDTGLGELKEMTENRPIVPKSNKGKVIDYDRRTEYFEFLQTYIPSNFNLNLAIDCSNGMASLFIHKLLGDKPIYLFEEIDGTFPNHEANPLEPENIVDLQHAVKQNGCDLGMIFDGDADRVMFVDENGKFISPDLMIALLGHYFLKDGKGGKVLQDIRTSKAVGEYLQKMGAEMHTWRVGRAFAAHKLREIDGIFGGELAGHYYFKDFYYSDSGILAALILLQVISDFHNKGKKLSELIAEIATYKCSGEINFKINQKTEAMESVKDFYLALGTHTAFFDFDGYRIEFKDWWLNVRPSNTEPYLRLIVEAETDAQLAEKVAEIKQIITQFN